MVALRKNTCAVELQAGIATYFLLLHFYLREQLIDHGYLELGICRHFLKNNQDSSRKTTDSTVANDKMICCQVKIINLENLCLPP